jgi:hypothetical protein
MSTHSHNPYSAPIAKLQPASLHDEQSAIISHPSGVGGWLLFPLIGLFVDVPATLFQFAQSLHFIHFMSMIEPFGLITKHPYSKSWIPIIIMKICFSLLNLAFSCYLMFLFYIRSIKLPRLYTLALIIVPCFTLIQLALVFVLHINSFYDLDLDWVIFVKSVCSAALWIPYFDSSIRVKNTFTHEVA